MPLDFSRIQSVIDVNRTQAVRSRRVEFRDSTERQRPGSDHSQNEILMCAQTSTSVFERLTLVGSFR